LWKINISKILIENILIGGGVNNESQSIMSILFVVFGATFIIFLKIAIPRLLFHRWFALTLGIRPV